MVSAGEVRSSRRERKLGEGARFRKQNVRFSIRSISLRSRANLARERCRIVRFVRRFWSTFWRRTLRLRVHQARFGVRCAAGNFVGGFFFVFNEANGL